MDVDVLPGRCCHVVYDFFIVSQAAESCPVGCETEISLEMAIHTTDRVTGTLESKAFCGLRIIVIPTLTRYRTVAHPEFPGLY